MGRLRTVDPLQGSILKNMVLFSLPVMGMMIMSMLFSSVDTMVIGRFGHENAVSAIGVSAALINMISGGLVALGEGITILLSDLYGEGNQKRIQEIAELLPLTGMILGGGAALMMFFAARPVLQLLNCPEAVMGDAVLYFRIYFLTMIFSLPYEFMAGALNAKGDSLSPFKFQLAAQIMNAGLNLFTVIVLDWNIFGVAMATLISQMVSFLLILGMFVKRQDELHIDLRKMRAFTGMGEIFRLGIPSSAEGLIINFSAVVISAYINSFSPDVIAGNTIGQSLEGFVAVSFTGFSSAAIVFTAQNYGAGNLKRVRKCYLVILCAAVAAAEILGILMYLASPVLTSLFTADAAIASYARVRMFYMCMFFGLCGGMNIISGCIRGLKDTISPLAISIFCSVIVRLTWTIFYAGPSGRIELIYAGFPLCWALSTILCMIVFEADIHKVKIARN